MNTLDIIYIGIMVVSLAVSSLRGGIREVFSLAAIVIGFMTAARFYGLMSGQLLRLTSHQEVNNIISFLVIFLFIAILISYIGGQLTHIVKKANLGFWNMMAGTALGTLKGLFVCALLTYALLVLMKPGGGLFSGSKAFPYVSQITTYISPIGPRHFRDELGRKMDALFGPAKAEAADGPGRGKPAPPKNVKPAVQEASPAPDAPATPEAKTAGAH